MAGDLAAARLNGTKVDPASFLGDVDGEFGEQRAPDTPSGDRGRTPESGARYAQLRRVDPSGEKEGRVERQLDPGCGKNLIRHAVDTEFQVVRGQREVGQYPEMARPQAQALFGQLRGEAFGQELGQLRRAVEVGDPAERQLDGEQQKQARVRQPAQEFAEGGTGRLRFHLPVSASRGIRISASPASRMKSSSSASSFISTARVLKGAEQR